MLHEWLTGCGLRLGQLALVMREHQVAAAAVNVDARSEEPQRHGTAFDVPAGPSRSERRVPHRLVGFRRLPQHEVERVALAGVVGGSAPLGCQGPHLLLVETAQSPELRPGGHIEPGGAVAAVGVASGDKLLDEGDHLVSPVGGPRLGGRRASVERVHVVVEPSGLRRGELQEVDAQLAGFGQDRVVHVGDVAHQPHRVAKVFQPPD